MFWHFEGKINIITSVFHQRNGVVNIVGSIPVTDLTFDIGQITLLV
jgi:hypothetical protein